MINVDTLAVTNKEYQALVRSVKIYH